RGAEHVVHRRRSDEVLAGVPGLSRGHEEGEGRRVGGDPDLRAEPGQGHGFAGAEHDESVDGEPQSADGPARVVRAEVRAGRGLGEGGALFPDRGEAGCDAGLQSGEADTARAVRYPEWTKVK